MKRQIRVTLAALVAASFLLMGHYAPLPLVFHELYGSLSGWGKLTVTGLRYEAEQPKGESFSLSVSRPDSFKLQLDSKPTTANAAERRFIQLLLSANSKTALLDKLKSWDVDVKTLELGMIDRTICYILGAKQDQSHRPQLWIDKFSHQPVRLLLFAAENGKTQSLEIRMQNWDNPASNGRFPQTVSFSQNGQPVSRWTLLSMGD